MSEVVYQSDGPVRLRLERTPVEAAGRKWLQHRLVVQDGADGVVAIVVRDGCLLLVHQYRPAVGESLWELPRGFAEAGDAGADRQSSANRTAAREVREETGLELLGCTSIGWLWADSGVLAGAVSVVLGRADPSAATVGTDEEADDVQWLPVAAVRDAVSRGVIRDGISLAALAIWWARES